MKYILKLLPRKRSRTSKKILGFLAIFALSGLFLQGNVGSPEVHAADGQTTVQNGTTGTQGSLIDKLGLVELLDLILKVIYVLLWPLLVIAGRSLDNTLIYGSIFHLDVPLWKFWNIIKNFANFTLGFLVLYAILKSIFSNSGMGTLKDDKTPLGIIKKTLIAGILIQASRFLLAATIDVSTVATYAVGGLPMSVLKNTELGQKKILAVDSNIDFNKLANMNDQGDILSLTYRAGDKKLSACKLSNNGDDTAAYRYIIGRKQMTDTEKGLCVLGGNTVMVFDEDKFEDDPFWTTNGSNGVGNAMTYASFVQGVNGISVNPTTRNTWIQEKYIIDIYNQVSFSPAQSSGATRFAGTPAIMLSDLITKSKGFVGPMVMIYSSLLNFAEISDTGGQSFGKVSGEMLIRTAFAIMLFFPLLALAVVLIIRVGFLWMIIAASPFVVLASVFDKTLNLPESIKKQLDRKSILSVIFAPVLTVFALSIALIFMTTLIGTLNPPSGQGSNISTALSDIQKLPTDGSSQKYLVGGQQIELVNFNRGGTMDRFSRLVINLVSVGLMRALVFAAIKANSLTKKTAESIEKFGTGFMSTLPIFSTPRGKAGIGSVANEVGNLVGRDGNDGLIINRRKMRDQANVQRFIEEKFPTAENSTTTTAPTMNTTQIQDIIKSNPTSANITEAFKSQGITDTSAAINNNGTMIYNEIMGISGDDKKKNELLNTFQTASGNKNWIKERQDESAQKAFEEIFEGIDPKDLDAKKIEEILNETKHKTTVDTFFAIDKNKIPYTTENGKFTINGTSGKYTATEKK